LDENDSKPDSAVSRAERVLRARILAGTDGQFLGSETALIDELGVSRPTFRQVAKLLEREQLIEIRRGVGGGFYGRKPSIAAVAAAASTYLQFERATLRDAMLAAVQLSREAVRLASYCRDAEARARLERFIEDDRAAVGRATSIEDFVASELAFIELLAQLGGNPVITLFITILYSFAGPAVGRIIFDQAVHMDASRVSRIEAGQAVLARDPELAMLRFRRHTEAQYAWVRALRGEGGLEVPLF